jgi:hypothetical protein
MATTKQTKAAKANIKKAQKAAAGKKTIAHMPDSTRRALGKQGPEGPEGGHLSRFSSGRPAGSTATGADPSTRRAFRPPGGWSTTLRHIPLLRTTARFIG